jgi:hypothetical protein
MIKIELIFNIDKIHTTVLGIERIKKNLDLNSTDVVKWCKDKIKDQNCHIFRKGKNWYATISNYVITVNAYSYTIITAHKEKNDIR